MNLADLGKPFNDDNDSSDPAEGDGEVDAPLDMSIEHRQSLERLIHNGSAEPEPYLELARIHRALDKPFEALKVLEKAMRFVGDSPEVAWEQEEASLARSLQRMNDMRNLHDQHPTPTTAADFDRAQMEWAIRRASVCRKRLTRDPSQVHLNNVMAEALYEMSKYDEAIEATDAALDHPVESPKAYLVRGLCLQSTRRDLEALSSFRKAALRRQVQAPTKVRLMALRHAAELAFRLGLTATCRRYINGILHLNPGDADAEEMLNNLAKSHESEILAQEAPENATSRR